MLSFVSTATDRGLLSSPTPTPRDPMICTRRKSWLASGASLEGGFGAQPGKSKRVLAARSVERRAWSVRYRHAPRTTHHAFQITKGATARASSIRHSALTCALCRSEERRVGKECRYRWEP